MSAPKDDPRGEWTYRCTSCGDEIDQDHDYCSPCDQRGGEWELTGPDGEPVDTNNYGAECFKELIDAATLLLAHLDQCLESPEMQTKIDKYGNKACRTVRAGVRVSRHALESVLRRAKV